MVAQVEDAPNERRDWTGGGMAAACMADYFASDCIFLGGECEGGEGGKFDAGQVGSVGRKVLVAETKGDVFEAERLVFGACRWVSVFAWSEEEEETQRGKVCCGV